MTPVPSINRLTSATPGHVQPIRRTWETLYTWRAGQGLTWQVLGLLLIWAYISALHWHNDGLWPQGDAARHAANGVFWWDFLARFPVNPIEFALSYYARYPVIHPTAYPPVFYLLEGTAYALFGVSPFVAKHLVLLFTLLTGFYVMAWLRRWVAQEAGWGSLLLLLQPGVIHWSHAIMLNIPAMALSLAALYHTRRWFEAPASRHVYLSAAFALLTVLTYIPAGTIVMVILAWVAVERRWAVFKDPRVLSLIALSALFILPWGYVAIHWAPTHVASIAPRPQLITRLAPWLYYAQNFLYLTSSLLLGMAGLGVLIGCGVRSWRREVKLALIWAVVCYLVLSYMRFKAARYALLLVPLVVILSCGGAYVCIHWVTTRLGTNPSWAFFIAMVALLIPHVATAHRVKVPIVRGFQEVVAFAEQQAPHGRFFYDGRHDGIFSFYLRAGDPQFERGVILGDKLLYASAIYRKWRLTEKVASPEEVVEAFRKRCGCEWLAIARSTAPSRIDAVGYLYQALEGPEFQLVRSFPIRDSLSTHVDIYRFIPTTVQPDDLELPFPNMGQGTTFRAKPIER